MTTWTVNGQARRGRVEIVGDVVEPLDGDEADVPFTADFSAVVLPGIAAYVASEPRPWRLTVTAGGEFFRDGGRCEVVELYFAWTTAGSGDAMLEIGARVVSEFSAPEANVDQPLARWSGAEVEDLRGVVADLLAGTR